MRSRLRSTLADGPRGPGVVGARQPWTAAALAIVLRASGAQADAPADAPTQEEIEAWLEASALRPDVTATPEAPEAPPPPPRRHGFVIESSVGALGHLGDLRHVSPTSPWLRLLLGWEPTPWVMLIVAGDVALSNTSYAARPPEPRTYLLYGAGGGARLTLELSARFGTFLQGEIGAARVSEDVLASYGYADADRLNPYYGATLGIQWHPLNPHYTVALHGGLRNHGEGLDRRLSGATPLVWTGGLSIRYAF